jgi:hypothetical protein
MKIGTDQKLWVVVDPATPGIEIGGNCFESSVRDLERRFRCGFTCERNPALFTDRREAQFEAFGRLTAMRAERLIAERAEEGRPIEGACTLEIHDDEGKVVYRTEIDVPSD